VEGREWKGLIGSESVKMGHVYYVVSIGKVSNGMPTLTIMQIQQHTMALWEGRVQRKYVMRSVRECDAQVEMKGIECEAP